MNGVNICATGCTAASRTAPSAPQWAAVPQTAAYQMRSSATFSTNLAAGQYGGAGGVASSLNTLDYSKLVVPQPALPVTATFPP